MCFTYGYRECTRTCNEALPACCGYSTSRQLSGRAALEAHRRPTSSTLRLDFSTRIRLEWPSASASASNRVESTAISFRLSAARSFRGPREFGSVRSAPRSVASRDYSTRVKEVMQTRRGPAGPRRLRSSCCRCSGRYPIGSNRIRSGHRISGDGVRRVPADGPWEAGARGARTERSGLIFHPIHRA